MGRIHQFCCSVSYTLECSDRNIPKLLLINLIKHNSFLRAYLNSTHPINNQRYPTTECWPIPLSLSIFRGFAPWTSGTLCSSDPHHCPMLAHSQ